MSKYIYHVTMSSGHVAKQYRRDIMDEVIADLSETLDGILQGAYMPVPGFADYLVNGTHTGSNLIATVWSGPRDSLRPILTTATALKSRSSPKLWRLMHDQATTPFVTDPAAPPKAPWTADRIEVGMLYSMSASSWTGDFARCLAWTWAEYAQQETPK